MVRLRPPTIPDIKVAWKYPSVNLVGFALAVQGMLVTDPHALDWIPERLRHAIIGGALLIAAYDRLVAHPAPAAPEGGAPLPFPKPQEPHA